MKLVVLSDAKAMDGYGSEHGLSFLIEVDNQPTLFDTGASDVFLKNARILGMDLNVQARSTIQFLHDLGVNQVLPSHCTLEPALSTFRDRFKSQDLLVGSVRYF